MDYGKALIDVSKQFVEEKVVGNSGQLKPLINKISSKPNLQLSVISPRSQVCCCLLCFDICVVFVVWLLSGLEA